MTRRIRPAVPWAARPNCSDPVKSINSAIVRTGVVVSDDVRVLLRVALRADDISELIASRLSSRIYSLVQSTS